MALISKNNLNKVYTVYIIKNPKKSDLQVGDICVTAEKESTNMYIAVNPKTINYLEIDTAEPIQLLQTNEDHLAMYLDVGIYDKNLKYSTTNKNFDYTVKLLFRFNIKLQEYNTITKLKETMMQIYDKICKIYPNEVKQIIFTNENT